MLDDKAYAYGYWLCCQEDSKLETRVQDSKL